MNKIDSVVVSVTGRVEDDRGRLLVMQGGCVGTGCRIYGSFIDMLSYSLTVFET